MDKIKDYLPLMSAFFLIIGALRLIYFYGFFGIDVISYIELSEIFTLSLSFFINGFVTSLIFLILFIPVVTDNYVEKEPDRKIAAIGVLLMLAFMPYWFFNTYDIFGDYIIDMRISYDYVIFLALGLLIPILNRYIIPALRLRILKLFDLDINRDAFFVMTMIIGIFSLCVLQSRSAARDLLLKRKPQYVEIKLDSVVVKSSYYYRFIGKTKNFIFFYDLKNNVSDAYSIEGNKKMSFPNELPSLQIGGLKKGYLRQ